MKMKITDISRGLKVKAPEKPKAVIIPLNNVTRLDLPPDRILAAATGQLESVVLVGYDKDGEIYCASSIADGGTVLWLMEKLKLKLLGLE